MLYFAPPRTLQVKSSCPLCYASQDLPRQPHTKRKGPVPPFGTVWECSAVVGLALLLTRGRNPKLLTLTFTSASLLRLPTTEAVMYKRVNPSHEHGNNAHPNIWRTAQPACNGEGHESGERCVEMLRVIEHPEQTSLESLQQIEIQYQTCSKEMPNLHSLVLGRTLAHDLHAMLDCFLNHDSSSTPIS